MAIDYSRWDDIVKEMSESDSGESITASGSRDNSLLRPPEPWDKNVCLKLKYNDTTTCLCAECIKETVRKTCGFGRNPVLVDVESESYHELRPFDRPKPCGCSCRCGGKAHDERKHRSKSRGSPTAINPLKKLSDAKAKKQSRNKGYTDYQKWDKLAAELSDSDDNSGLSGRLHSNGDFYHVKLSSGKDANGKRFCKLDATLRSSNQKKKVAKKQQVSVKSSSTLPDTRRLVGKPRAAVDESLTIQENDSLGKQHEYPLKSRFSWKFSVDTSRFQTSESKSKRQTLCSHIETDVHGFQWRLIFYPVGDKNDQFVSVFLEVPNHADLPFGWRRKVKFAITVVNQSMLQTLDIQKHSLTNSNESVTSSKTRKECHVFKGIEGDFSWGWPQFLKADRLLSKDMGKNLDLEIIADLEVVESTNIIIEDDLVPYLSMACSRMDFDNITHCINISKKLEKDIINLQHHGNAPLHAVCMAEDPPALVVQLLLKHGADVNMLNAERETPVLLACYYGQLAIVEELLKNGADLQIGPSLNGLCCAGAACQSGDESVLRLVLKKCPGSINGLGNGCCIPLKQALQLNNWKCALALVEMGCSVTTNPADSEEYVLFVAKNGPPDCKLLFSLVDHGCPPNATDKFGETAMRILLFDRKLRHQAYNFYKHHGASLNCSPDRKTVQKAKMLLAVEERNSGQGDALDVHSIVNDEFDPELRELFLRSHALFEDCVNMEGDIPQKLSAYIKTLSRGFEAITRNEPSIGEEHRKLTANFVGEMGNPEFEKKFLEFEKYIESMDDPEKQKENAKKRFEKKKLAAKLNSQLMLEKEKRADEIAKQLLLEEEMAKLKQEKLRQKRKKKKDKKKKKKVRQKDRTDETSTTVSGGNELFHDIDFQTEQLEEPPVSSVQETPIQSTILEERISLETENEVASTREPSQELHQEEESIKEKLEVEEKEQYLQAEPETNIDPADIIEAFLIELGGQVDFTDSGIDKLLSLGSATEQQLLLTAMSEDDKGLKGIIKRHSARFQLCSLSSDHEVLTLKTSATELSTYDQFTGEVKEQSIKNQNPPDRVPTQRRESPEFLFIPETQYQRDEEPQSRQRLPVFQQEEKWSFSDPHDPSSMDQQDFSTPPGFGDAVDELNYDNSLNPLPTSFWEEMNNAQAAFPSLEKNNSSDGFNDLRSFSVPDSRFTNAWTSNDVLEKEERSKDHDLWNSAHSFSFAG